MAGKKQSGPSGIVVRARQRVAWGDDGSATLRVVLSLSPSAAKVAAKGGDFAELVREEFAKRGDLVMVELAKGRPPAQATMALKGSAVEPAAAREDSAAPEQVPY